MINSIRGLGAGTKPETLTYNLNGEILSNVDSSSKVGKQDIAYASEIRNSEGTTYYILTDATVKPANPHTDLEDHQALRRGGGHKFRAVSKKCFDFYLSFLKTKNVHDFTNAIKGM